MEHTSDGQTRLLVHVRYAAAAVEECVHALREAVRDARSAGASWSQIGDAVGTSAQQALDEFGAAADGLDGATPAAPKHAAHHESPSTT